MTNNGGQNTIKDFYIYSATSGNIKDSPTHELYLNRVVSFGPKVNGGCLIEPGILAHLNITHNGLLPVREKDQKVNSSPAL